MESLTITSTIKRLNSKEIPLFTLNELGRILGIENRQSLYKKIARLEKRGILKKIIKGKYQYLLNPCDDFTLANFIYQPSYISLETALSFYGIITGFSYQITSITTKKAKKFDFGNKEYDYSKISTNFFEGFKKENNFLIATPEKALADYVYFAGKGLKNLDWEEIDMTNLDKKELFFWGNKMNVNISK